jgi:hypothetical protein
MPMRPVTDDSGQAVRVNPEHVTHVICYTDPRPPDTAIPERVLIHLVSGITLTLAYRSPGAARRAASDLDSPPAQPPCHQARHRTRARRRAALMAETTSRLTRPRRRREPGTSAPTSPATGLVAGHAS